MIIDAKTRMYVKKLRTQINEALDAALISNTDAEKIRTLIKEMVETKATNMKLKESAESPLEIINKALANATIVDSLEEDTTNCSLKPTNNDDKDDTKILTEKGAHTYENLWEEIQYRLDNAGVQINRPTPGKYDGNGVIGVNFDRYDMDNESGYIATTINAPDMDFLSFALDICAEYNLEKCDWSIARTFTPSAGHPGFYTIRETPGYLNQKYKLYIFTDVKQPAQHHGFVSKAKKKAEPAAV